MKGKKVSTKERRQRAEQSATDRRKLFHELCNHVAQGYSMDCFPPLSDTTIEKYLNLYPEEFCREELIEAQRKGKVFWEGLGRRQASGDCLGNSRTWYYNMANRYGWREKLDIEAEHKGQVQVNVVSYASKKASSNASKDE